MASSLTLDMTERAARYRNEAHGFASAGVSSLAASARAAAIALQAAADAVTAHDRRIQAARERSA